MRIVVESFTTQRSRMCKTLTLNIPSMFLTVLSIISLEEPFYSVANTITERDTDI
jgi:hypothetical protein